MGLHAKNEISDHPISLKVPGNDRKTRGDLEGNFSDENFVHAKCPRLCKVTTIMHAKFVKVGSVNICLLYNKGRPVESPMQRGEISLEVEEQVEEENLVNSEGNIKMVL